MSSCPKCGSAMSSTDNICPSCGAKVGTFGSSGGQQQVAYVKELPAGQRPLFATVLAGLSVIGAFAAFLVAGKIMPGVSALDGFATTFKALSPAMPYFLGFVGIISLGAAYGYFKGRHWAWKFGIVVSILGVISLIAPNLTGFIVGIISLYLLSSSKVKNWLRK